MTREPMNEERMNDLVPHDETNEGLDPLDAMFREAYGAPSPVDDEGFTDQVMAQLPRRRRRLTVRTVILSAAGALSLLAAALLPNGLGLHGLLGSGPEGSSEGVSYVNALSQLTDAQTQLLTHSMLLYGLAALAIIGFATFMRWESDSSRL